MKNCCSNMMEHDADDVVTVRVQDFHSSFNTIDL